MAKPDLIGPGNRIYGNMDVRGPGGGEVRITAEDLAIRDAARPKVLGDCRPGGENSYRPCPWVGCEFHLAREQNIHGTTKFDPTELPHTCSQDLAIEGGGALEGGGTLEEVGERFGTSRERIRQIEVVARIKVRRAIKRLEDE